MIEPIIIGVSATAGVSLGALALRDVFARATIKKACHDAEPNIEKFKKDNTYVTPLAEEFQKIANTMHSTLRNARDLRERIIDKLKSIRIPNSKYPKDLPELEKEMRLNHSIFFEVVRDTYTYKAQHLLKEQIQERLKKRHQDSAAKVFGSALHSASLQDTQHLDVFEKTMLKALDEMGVIDGLVSIVDSIHHFASAHLPEATVHHFIQVSELASSIYSMPAAYTGIQTGYQEIKMLLNDETSLDDALLNGGMKIGLKMGATKIGWILDAMTLGASGGAFTIAFSYGATLLTNEILESQNREYRAELEKLRDQIRKFYKKVLKAINQAVCEFEEQFSQKVLECPDINDNIAIKDFVLDLSNEYNSGHRDAEETLSVNTREAISEIPQNTLLEKLLFIDRRKAVEKLYLEAQREISSLHAGLVHNFSMAVQNHVEEAIRFMIEHGVFKSERIAEILGKMEEATLLSAETYLADLSQWEKEAIHLRTEGSKKVSHVIDTEGEKYRDFVDEREPQMEFLARRIRINNIRQGKTPSPQAA